MVTGSLVRGTERGFEPVARHWVVLHRVTLQQGGAPSDSTRTDTAGRWRFRVLQPDSTAVYFVSAMWDGIAYFSQPARKLDQAADTLPPIELYDTTAGRPPIALALRQVVIGGRKEDGTHDVLEIVELTNPGKTTRVTRDTLTPNWEGALPGFAIQFQVGESDVSSQTIVRRGDRLAVFAPIAPGTARQLSYAYTIPSDVRTAEFPIDQATPLLQVLVEDTLASVTGLPFRSFGRAMIANRGYNGYAADSVGAGGRFVVALPGTGVRPGVVIAVIVGAAAAALAYGLWRALRRPSPPMSTGPVQC